MNKITQKEFLQRLKNSDNLIMKELYYQWRSWIIREYKVYDYHENLILVKQDKDKYEVNMFIFNQKNCLDLFNQYKEDINCTKLCVSIIEKIPEQLDVYHGFRCFERIGSQEDINDNNIKLLTKEHEIEIIDFCNKLSNQGKISENEAISLKYYIENIDNIIYKHSKIYGYYKDNALVGFVEIQKQPKTNYAMLANIAVLEEYRRQGIGTQLSKFVLNRYPNDRYLYQVVKHNKESIGLLTSLGFKFVGGRELWVKG